ncbi:MAG: hypothetical protein ACR2JW_03810 [Thermomicrobiales bacterium]
MAFATRSRRAGRAQSTWTVVPFDARGAGVGEIPPAVAIETPHDGETLLVLCAEADRPDPEAMARCLLALDAFRAGFATVAPRMLTNALLAGMDEANDALYDHRAARAVHRPVGVGLTALVARGQDAYVIQAGPGQVLIVGDEGVTALPPLNQYRMFDSAPHDERAAPPPLGMSPIVEPDLFHVDAREGLFVALVVSALGRVLHHEDDAPLRSFDPANAADYLVALGARFRLTTAYGVVMAMGGDVGEPPYSVAPATEWDQPPARHHARREPQTDAFTEAWPGGDPLPDGEPRRRNPPGPLPPPEIAEEPRWEYLGEPTPRAGNRWRGGWFGRRPQRASAWDDPYRPRPARQIPALPPRLWMLLGGLLLTLLLAGLLGIVHALSAHRANDATIHALDGIAAARGQAVALHDPGAAYTTLVALDGQLRTIAADGRQTKRVAVERQQMVQALDTVTGVTRVTPRPVTALAHLDATPGNHRLLLAGDDGKLYLLDREKNDWGVYAVDLAAPKPTRLFGTGSVASKVPAGDVRGLVWSGGPATTDRTRLFARTANGTWGELAVPAVSDQRPTAVALLGDGLYLLDSGAGQIVRVPLANGGGAKPWTTDAAAAELRTAVDLTSDGQVLWVLLADGRVRGFVGGAPAQLIAPGALPPLTAATAVTTAASSPYLYVADGAQGRIVRIRKADGKIVQVLRAADGAPPIVSAQSLTVDEPRGTLSYVTADGIITIPLPPVVGV